MFKNLIAQLRRTLNPHEITGVYIDHKRVSSRVIGSVSGFLFLFILTNAIVTLYLFARGYDAVTSVSTAIACVGNIGPGFAQAGPAENFHFFSAVDKVILAVAMIIGRLEFYTVVLVFTRDFWKRY